MLLVFAALALAAPASAPSVGVLCIAPLPPPWQAATAGKGAGTPETYDDSSEARAARVEAAKQAKPVVFSVGDRRSVPVTDTQAACLDDIPLDARQQLQANGRPLLSFTLDKETPVRWLTFSAFYASDRLDPLPARLYCKQRSPTPDCSWCPCKTRKYVPPPPPR
jgi:hypothetical protein